MRVWFQAEARTYPWTLTRDPYTVWVSEVMLQQTVVTAAVGPFNAWMARWPDLASLASAPVSEVLRAWEGLGYPSRARNLHKSAQILVTQGKTTLPDTEPELRALPGVGEYTAAAVLSFAYDRPALTLDANLKRVFQRLGASPVWTKDFETLWRIRWSALVDGPSSREANQAVMQLGQRVCRPRNPLCETCPLGEFCGARSAGLTGQIPEPVVRTKVEKATLTVFWYRHDGAWWLARPDRGRFSNLWLAPPAETRPPEALSLAPRIHTYTKYRDKLTPYAALWAGPGDPPVPPGWSGFWASAAEVPNLGMVSVYRRILDGAISLVSDENRG